MCQLCSWARRYPSSKQTSSLLSTTAQFSQTVRSLKPSQPSKFSADTSAGRSPIPSSPLISTKDQPHE
ncbi:MAG: hypothetical protein ACFE0I_06890 [Elainellaceae cyanobacterium]